MHKCLLFAFWIYCGTADTRVTLISVVNRPILVIILQLKVAVMSKMFNNMGLLWGKRKNK